MISTHILDTSLGRPAEDVLVQLEKQTLNDWQVIASLKTNSDGRITFGTHPSPGIYKLTFYIDEYFKFNNIEAFFTHAPVIFKISDVQRKYHIPLLLNPFGYSTYRGS